ncbi:MAG: LPS export ABC transporter permease LptF [Anaerobiospirillum succiniciproducens]|uniref:LPS export ABC transporter permease LptF n=1 Tax=Anaerobiospirillum succiniciproducens TaxID=13335 RepID=UPI002A761F72|nr:LPS export ABC transporter permease LptF [Anaerobiospirillum succiniciproducens]MDY2799266.1 LPS export ABC transporter permease LptF [Anaerobiospirillum succiniciproducens]
MNKLDKYLFKEILKSQFVVLLVLVVAFAGQTAVKLMTEVAVGALPPRLIALFMFYSMPQFLTYLFPLTLYTAVIITLGRICSDSEMVVMKAVGYSSKRIMKVVLLLGALSASAVGYISLTLSAKASTAAYALEKQALTDPEFLPIESGRFVNFGKYNVYVEDVNNNGRDDKDVSNIYVIEMDGAGGPTTSITAADEGHIALDEDGVRWLELKNGRRYEYMPDGTMRRARFEEFKAPVSANVTEDVKMYRAISMMSTTELLNSDSRIANLEAQWRISPILTTLVVCLIAVPLSMVNPRQGRFARLAPAILIYLAYYLLLLSVLNFIKTENLGLYPGLYLVPVLFLICVALPLNMPKTYLKHIHQSKIKGSVLGMSFKKSSDKDGEDK